jgi:GDPmannose 4,6-dehydratase
MTRKVTSIVALIHLGKASHVVLGSLDDRRDWGHASDYMRGAYEMMQYEKADDFVLATGTTRSVRDFVVAAFRVICVEIQYEVNTL